MTGLRPSTTGIYGWPLVSAGGLTQRSCHVAAISQKARLPYLYHGENIPRGLPAQGSAPSGPIIGGLKREVGARPRRAKLVDHSVREPSLGGLGVPFRTVMKNGGLEGGGLGH